MPDEWEALFKIWHERAHDREGRPAYFDLEDRIVKLEAYVAARRKMTALSPAEGG